MRISRLARPLAQIRSRAGGVAFDVAGLVGASLIAQGINFINVLIQARLYGPADMGLFAVLLAIHMVISAVGTLKFDNAIVLSRNVGDASRLIWICMAASGIGALLVALVSASLLAAGVVSGGESVSSTAALPVLFLLATAGLTAQQWCARERRLGFVAMSGIATSIGILVGQSALAHSTIPGGLLWGYAIGQAAGLLVLAPRLLVGLAIWNPLGRPPARTFRQLLMTARRFHRFALYATPASLIYFALPQVAPLLIGIMISPASAGYFSLALRMTYTPFALLPAALRQAIYRPLAEAISTRTQEIWSKRLCLTMVALGLAYAGVTAMLLLFGPRLLGFALGPDWAPISDIIVIVAIGASAQALGTLLDRLFDLLQRQNWSLVLAGGGSIATLAAMAPAAFLTDSLTSAVMAWAVVNIAFTAIWVIAAARAADLDVRQFGQALGAIAWVFAILVGAAYAVRVYAAPEGDLAPLLWGGALVIGLAGLVALLLYRAAVSGLQRPS